MLLRKGPIYIACSGSEQSCAEGLREEISCKAIFQVNSQIITARGRRANRNKNCLVSSSPVGLSTCFHPVLKYTEINNQIVFKY